MDPEQIISNIWERDKLTLSFFYSGSIQKNFKFLNISDLLITISMIQKSQGLFMIFPPKNESLFREPKFGSESSNSRIAEQIRIWTLKLIIFITAEAKEYTGTRVSDPNTFRIQGFKYLRIRILCFEKLRIQIQGLTFSKNKCFF